jgi:hypothetical protein
LKPQGAKSSDLATVPSLNALVVILDADDVALAEIAAGRMGLLIKSSLLAFAKRGGYIHNISSDKLTR